MTRYRVIAVSILAVGLTGVCACSPTPPQNTPAPPAAAPPPPARPMVMICKNSQTGADAACGTPNAVMVGMKPA